MSEQEQEAIERSKKWIEFYRLREKTNYDFLFSIKEKDIPINEIEAVLNLTDKLQKENEELKERVNVFNKAIKCDKCDCNICEAEKIILKLQKENVELKKQVDIEFVEENYIEKSKVISKDKIRDKIEELKEGETIYNIYGNGQKYAAGKHVYTHTIKILQELLEAEEE